MSVAVVLGSGLGGFAETLESRKETPYTTIPGWPPSKVIGHAGKLIEGQSAGRDVIVLEKDHHPRFHIGESLLPAWGFYGNSAE